MVELQGKKGAFERRRLRRLTGFMTVLSDIEIAQATKLLPIDVIAKKAGVPEDSVEHYGKYKAKIDPGFLKDRKGKKGKLVLVTAITPTPAGE